MQSTGYNTGQAQKARLHFAKKIIRNFKVGATEEAYLLNRFLRLP